MSGSRLLKQHGGLVDSIRVLCPSIGNNPVPSAVERDNSRVTLGQWCLQISIHIKSLGSEFMVKSSTKC